jgi:hypothetical protein
MRCKAELEFLMGDKILKKKIIIIILKKKKKVKVKGSSVPKKIRFTVKILFCCI